MSFFTAVTKLVLALVMAYDEIFQALAADGDIPFSKPHLDPSFDNVITRKLLSSEMSSNLPTQENPKRPSQGCMVAGEHARCPVGKWWCE
jgi:hypothetical protein